MSTPTRSVSAVILAAGEGKRLKSDVAKVLHLAAGRPLIAHVLDAVAGAHLSSPVVIVAPEHEAIAQAVEATHGAEVRYVVQDEPRGTADAARTALEVVDNPAVLVLAGDSPLITSVTIARLIDLQEATSAAAVVLTAELRDPTGYGRILRSADGELVGVVEERDATPEQRSLREVCTSAYVFDRAKLAEVIDKVDRENAQGEYYLTDVLGLLLSRSEKVVTLAADSEEEVLGVNDRAQLARVSEVIRRRTCERWMAQGVTIIDPATTYIDAGVTIGSDTVVHPFTFLEGATSVGARAQIGPQTRIVDSAVGEDAVVSFAVVIGSEIGPEASVGPFASLRPGTRLARRARAGTFVETKNTTIGEDSKANHLAYLGDARIGRGVNIGAGTITCNWDGREKHETVIEDEAYISSDTMIVAPAHIGKRAATGAGAVVKGEVPDGALAVGMPARIIAGKGDRMGRADDDGTRRTDEREE